MRSAMPKMLTRSCETTTQVTPSRSLSSRMRASTRRALTGSRLVVGSSKSTYEGSRVSARAMATRLRMPSPSSAGKRSANSSMRTCSSRRFASARASASRRPLCLRSGSATFSTQLMLSKSVECWKTIAHFLRTGYISRSLRRLTSWPSSTISPPSGESRPTRCLMSTLLPTPEAPMMKKTSPRPMSNDTSLSTTLGPKAFLTRRKEITRRPSPQPGKAR